MVLGLELNGLGIVRSLAEAPFPVRIIGFDTDPSRPSARSRFARVRRVASLDAPSLIEDLAAFARQEPTPPVLFPTQEKTVDLLSRHRATLAPLCRFLLPEADALARLTDKAPFTFARNRTWPPPRRSASLAR